MKPERWQQIDQLLETALERPPAERAAFLAETCAGDETLRQEVESLLRSDETANSFIETPVVALAAEVLAQQQAQSLTGQQFGHYQILSPLGAGGMGEVYLADDTKLHRRVALKLLPAKFAADQDAGRRFLREARAAAALEHPNICAIYEIGEDNSHRFIVMQYVEGETLADRLKRAQLSLNECLSLAAQIADALAEAHAHQIIHRDIKPANVIVTPRGQVKVLDFGLAKFMTETPEANNEASAASQLSTPGLVLGTVPYMSPEQLRGEQLDARTDIFSFGTMLYEMISGQQPFAGATTAEVIAAILEREPPPLQRFAADLPAELERIVRKCLEKNPGQRYQTICDLAIDLGNLRQECEAARITGSQREGETRQKAVTPTEKNVERSGFTFSRFALAGIALLVMASAAALAYLFTFRGAANGQQPEIKSLAVLPLKNLSGDAEQEYFADGMTEALISNLAQIRALKVISRTSVMRYKGISKSLPEIARELNVDAVIEGSVQHGGGRVKITARLIQAVDETLLRSFDYERELADVLNLEGEIARMVAEEIRIQVTANERARLTAARRIDPQAHEAYLRGRYDMTKLNEENLRMAIENFERAIQLAPDYAAAYAGLSEAWLERSIWGKTPFREAEAPARIAATQALRLDDQLAEAHGQFAHITYIYDWDWFSAEQGFKRALEMNPGSLYMHRPYASFLMALGRHAEAISEMENAERLDPLSSEIQSTFGRVLYRARKYEEAIPHFKRAIELNPRNYSAHVRLGDVNVMLGRYDEAISVYEKADQLRSGPSFHSVRIARVYALMGKRNEARQMVSRVSAGAFNIAAVYAALGDKDEAFRILGKAVAERNSLLVFIKEDPTFDNLHSDPRWKEILRRMNFPSE